MARGSMAGCFLDLSKNVKLRLTGADRQRFLNGQITNDVRKAGATNAIEACLLDAKGRMSGHVFLFAAADFYLLDGDPAQKETLQPRLERYVIADDVVVEDVSDQWSILHVVGQSAPELAGAKWMVAARRFQEPGWDLWLEPARRAEALAQLSTSLRFCNDDCAEIARIEQGIPRWGRELTPEIIPIEANLEERCVDYEKGCYLGQEVVSRMKMSGQRNKELRGLISNGPLAAGMRLVEAAGQEKAAGWITSVSPEDRSNRSNALGFVKRGFTAAGTRLLAVGAAPGDEKGRSVEVVDLPFGQ